MLVEKLTNYKLSNNGQCFDFAFLGESMINIYVVRFIPKGNTNCFTEYKQSARDPYRLRKKIETNRHSGRIRTMHLAKTMIKEYNKIFCFVFFEKSTAIVNKYVLSLDPKVLQISDLSSSVSLVHIWRAWKLKQAALLSGLYGL